MTTPTVADQIAALIQKTADRRDKELARLSERAKKLAADATQLATDIAVFVNGGKNIPQPNGADEQPKRTRKPTEATADQIAQVQVVLVNFAMPISIKAIFLSLDRKVGTRTIAAALRQLVAEGKAVEGPRGKFKPAAAAQEADGASA